MARKAVVPIRPTTDECERLYEAARSVGLSLSEYIRRLVLKKPLPQTVVLEVNRETYRELCRVGNNLNQLMKAVHEGKILSIDIAQLSELNDVSQRSRTADTRGF